MSVIPGRSIATAVVLAAAIGGGVATLPATATGSASCGSLRHGAVRVTDIQAVSAMTCNGARSIVSTWLAIGKYPAPHSGWTCSAHSGTYRCQLRSQLGQVEAISFRLHR